MPHDSQNSPDKSSAGPEGMPPLSTQLKPNVAANASWMKKLKIGTRIYAGFAILLMIMIGLVLSSLIELSKLETAFSHHNKLSRQAALSADIRASVFDLQLKARAFIASSKDEDKHLFVTARDKLSIMIKDAEAEIKEPTYAELISSTKARMDSYNHAFLKIATLLDRRNELLYDILSPLGRDIREGLTSINEGAFAAADYESSSQAGKAQENLLLARLYAMKFVDDNEADSAERTHEELSKLEASLAQLDVSLQNLVRRKILAKVSDGVPDYRRGFAKLVDVINERNRLRDAVLDADAKQMVADTTKIEARIESASNLLQDQKTKDLRNATLFQQAFGLAALMIGLIAGLIIARSITKPVLSLTHVMKQLANNDLAVTVPGCERGDELGQMADAVQIFKQASLRNREMEAEQARAEERAAQEKRAMMMDMADSFDSHVGGIVNAVSSASTQLSGTAQSMSDVSEETAQQAAQASAASTQTLSNVQTIASATEEMTATIAEISEQVGLAATSAIEAVKKVDETSEQMGTLEETAHTIGKVVEMIASIAEQTNLLALNATIESARAGEAGKGFAVVAGEVKALAGQTAKATDDIGKQIASIQAASKQASGSMDAVSNAIQTVSEISTAIAAAMEEQNTATSDIANSLNQAAQGSELVNDNVSAVSDASKRAGAASGEVMGAAGDLSDQASKLKLEVDRFINQVRTG